MYLCVKCGKKAVVGAFCWDCYEPSVTVPSEFIIKRCSKCGRVWVRGEWKEFNIDVMESAFLSKCKGEFSYGKIDWEGRSILLFFKVGDKYYKKDYLFDVSYEMVLCEDCSRRLGGYYEAIIQLRGEEYKVKKVYNVIVKKLSKKTFISKLENVKGGGVDIYVGSSKAVYEVITSLGLTYKVSKKLHGVRDGKRVYRTTFSVRL